jgi:hypothetical protein
MMLLICPSCQAGTPDDGRHCDQCGTPLRRCPTCDTVSTGSFCPNDRTPLTGNAPAASPVPAPAGPGVRMPPPVSPVQAPPAGSVPMRPVPPSVRPGERLRPAIPTPPTDATRRGLALPAAPPVLRFAAVNLPVAPFDVAPGDLLGRSAGRHAPVLAPLHDQGVSGRHARVDWTPGGGWTITDVGSSYGVDVRPQNAWPTPERNLPRDQAHPLSGTCYVRLGDAIFQVTPAREER